MNQNPDPSAPMSWPSGGFQWHEKWVKHLPVVRGIHVPDTPQLRQADLVELPEFGNSDNTRAMAARAGRPWSRWSPEESRSRITRQALAQRDLDFWLELLLQTQRFIGPPDAWPMPKCIELHGLGFAVEVLLVYSDMLDASGQWKTVPWPQLRLAIAGAGEADYLDAYHVAERLRAGNPGRMLHCSYLFPHVVQWSTECLQHCLEHSIKDDQSLLNGCTMEPSQFLQYMGLNTSASWECIRGGTLLQIRCHGAASFDVLAAVVRQLRVGFKRITTELYSMARAFQEPRLVALLAEDVDAQPARRALESLMAEHPAAVLHTLFQTPEVRVMRETRAWALKLAQAHRDALPMALEKLDERVRARIEQDMPAAPPGKPMSTSTSMPAPATEAQDLPEALPPLLRNPPWLAKVRPKAVPALAVSPIATEERITFTEPDLEQVRNYKHPAYLQDAAARAGFYAGLYLTSAGTAHLLRGEPLQAGDVVEPSYAQASPDMVLAAPEAARVALWNSYPTKLWSQFPREAVRKLLVDYGTAAIPGLCAVASTYPFSGFEMALPVDSPALVEPALQAFRHHRRGKANAQAWMVAHARTVFFRALPLALQSGATRVRDNARHGIRWLMDNGFGPVAREVAASYGADMTAALEALRDMDPLLMLPNRMPSPPPFFSPAVLKPPLLEDGTPLPTSAIEHLAAMLAISTLEEPYAGLEIVKRSCRRASLAEFAWDLFQAWLFAGAPPKQGWAFAALGLLGDDETARRLSPLIRNWPSEGASARAVAGLDMLAAIGSDVALMHLDAIADKAKTYGLKEKAREKIRVIAEARDLTREQLADRLVPRLGLDATGALELDFGPRKFAIRFDEALKPFVKDANGVRLKDLPKPNQGDDVYLAKSASDRYKQIKKDAKLIGDQQVARMERAMVNRRRWSGEEFDSLFLRHPVMRNLAARLAWGVYQDDVLVTCFRVAEDWTLADANDCPFTLGPGAMVGMPHPVEIPSQTLQAMARIFGDYEIIQPFKQLGRETYTLTPQERGTDVLTRYRDKVLVTASVLGLAKRGWEATGGDGGGWVSHLARPFGNFRIEFRMEPGTIIGNPLHEPKQKIPAVSLSAIRYHPDAPQATFASLDPIHASEILRDFELLAPVKE